MKITVPNNFMEIRMAGGVFELGNSEGRWGGGGLSSFWNPGGGGGQKTVPSIGGGGSGVDLFLK